MHRISYEIPKVFFTMKGSLDWNYMNVYLIDYRPIEIIYIALF